MELKRRAIMEPSLALVGRSFSKFLSISWPIHLPTLK